MSFTRYANYDVWGLALLAYIGAFRQYPSVLDKYFKTRMGIDLDADPDSLKAIYVPMDKWLDVTHALVEEVGSNSVYTVGKRIAEASPLPPGIDDVAQVLFGIEMAYHMHHRKDGVAMLDPATGIKLDGLGHYACEILEGGTSAQMTCDNPYPCDLDRGIIAGFTARFQTAVSVSHATTACRKKGDKACVYLVQW